MTAGTPCFKDKSEKESFRKRTGLPTGWFLFIFIVYQLIVQGHAYTLVGAQKIKMKNGKFENLVQIRYF